MSNKTIKDGGPAFPRTVDSKVDLINDSIYPQNGMTLRDWFAGQALVGLLANETEKWCFKDERNNEGKVIKTRQQFCATECYLMANAMLEARDKEGV